mmetsp:Transcript_11220/g.39793  ORF Transcript_11220/g.39793 Transcript_11220/m.39793 type:complete len:262 (-) Transcript_11220:126-911(-)|eukprot:CAMPEP_0203949188 /NCGR_PEP_ID=MMETSP0359-20131031/83656_1 /ASSEMBLY_ACC=CAM_ASM_000338 /TAXON_ID=268821 /ORGANISM="Scrippsiella Hangoei, Strain SHTV-5" /LENGTH=261 /DNA_ID=CAMNT_0050881015 /DNA_START=41 /DNA_END=826 /DNA_ORIENTATION=+
MVVPMGGQDGPGQSQPPPPELLRFKPALFALAMCYFVLLILGMTSGQSSNALSYIFVGLVTLFMSVRADQCMSQCLLPFLLWTVMNLFLDVISLITVLARPYPSAAYFFAENCAMNRTLLAPAGTVVQTMTGNITDYIFRQDTKVQEEVNPCSGFYVLGNVVLLLGLALDIIACVVARKMFNSMQSAGGGGNPLLGAFGGGQGPGLGGGGGAGGAGGPGFGGPRPGGGPTQEMSSPPGQPQAGRGPGFQPFQGSGHTLNAH